MARVPIRHGGEIYFYYDSAEHWMSEDWKRFMVEVIINRAWQWRRWGFDPPVGCSHTLSWQAVILALMPFFYVLCADVARLITA